MSRRSMQRFSSGVHKVYAEIYAVARFRASARARAKARTETRTKSGTRTHIRIRGRVWTLTQGAAWCAKQSEFGE